MYICQISTIHSSAYLVGVLYIPVKRRRKKLPNSEAVDYTKSHELINVFNHNNDDTTSCI